MANATVKEQEQVQEEVAQETVEAVVVTLKLRKTLPKRLINAITSANNVQVEETDEYFTLKGNSIRVSRTDVEAITGKLSDGRWRMLFVNREGELNEFNNYEFSMAVPRPVIQEVVENTELAQINIRLPKDLKEEIKTYGAYLDLNQNDFVIEAIIELISQLKKEMIA